MRVLVLQIWSIKLKLGQEVWTDGRESEEYKIKFINNFPDTSKVNITCSTEVHSVSHLLNFHSLIDLVKEGNLLPEKYSGLSPLGAGPHKSFMRLGGLLREFILVVG